VKNISEIKTALIYADAMYEGADKNGELDALYQDAIQLKKLADDDTNDLYKLNNPLLKFEQKSEILDIIAQKCGLCNSMLNTLKLLAQNNDFKALPQTLEQFILLYQDKHNIAQIEVTTVIPLSQQQENLLKTKLSAIFKRDILLHYVINPQIIGGLVLKYGTHFIDNSIKHKLDALEQLMKGTK
jgi:F-type H+-transporting ATPase subunit delta